MNHELALCGPKLTLRVECRSGNEQTLWLAGRLAIKDLCAKCSRLVRTEP